MSWNIVRDELLDKVVSQMRIDKQADGRRWVELLEQSADGKRLGACIVIDVRSGALPATTFASILECLDFSKEGSRKSANWAFHDALRNHPANRNESDHCNFVCSSRFSIENASDFDDEYVRILDLSDFIVFVLNCNDHPFSALSQDDRERAKRMYFNGFDSPWEAISKMWSGGKGRVFITALKDLTDLTYGQDDPAGNLNDALGLAMKGNLELVAVKYAAGLEFTVHQPTTLDGNWADDNWYLSHKGDNKWGLTHRCSGVGLPARERVHKQLPTIEEGFSGLYVGCPKQAVREDRDKLLEDAFARM